MQLPKKTTCAFLAGLVVLLGGTAVSAAPVLYATDTDTASLYTLDPADGSSTLVGSFGVDGYMAGLGYDPGAGVLFGTTTGTDNLYSIDRSSGNANLIGPLGHTLMHGLEYDASTDTLFGAFGESQGDGLYDIDTSTGAATLIGHIGYFHPDHRNTVHGLAVHPETGVLYGTMGGPASWGALIEINKTTGQGTLIGEFTQHIGGGLAFHPEANVLFATANWSNELYTIDITTGQPTLVGSTGLDNSLGLAFIPEPTTLALLGFGSLLAVRRRHR